MRHRHAFRMKLGEQLPAHFMCIIIDGMDNNKTVIPHLAEAPKDVDGTLFNTVCHKEFEYVGTCRNW